MKRYEIIKKTKMNSDGSEYDSFYIRKSFLGIKYTMTKSLFDNTYFSQQTEQELFILISLLINCTFLIMNFVAEFNNDDRILGISLNIMTLIATVYLNYNLFPLRFNSVESAKEYVTLIIKRKAFKSSITKVGSYNVMETKTHIDLEYFEENNRLVRINKLKL